MLIELSQLPQAMQEYLLGDESEVVQVVNDGQVITSLQVKKPEDAYYEHFYAHHFDVEKLAQAIGETDENGRAKHAITIPKGLSADKEVFRQWLKANAS